MSLSRRGFLAGLLAAPVAVPAIAAGLAKAKPLAALRAGKVTPNMVRSAAGFGGIWFTGERGPELFLPPLGRTFSPQDIESFIRGRSKVHDGAPTAPTAGALPASAGAPS